MPDLDMLIARLQAVRPQRSLGGGPAARACASPAAGRILLLGLVVVVLWLGSGFYRVQPDELGVVLRFGAYSYRTAPGLHWHLPWPIEQRPAARRHPHQPHRDRLPLGRPAERRSRERGQAGRDVPAESLMLTGDENIIDINFAVFWKISNADGLPVQHPRPGQPGQGGGGKLDARGDRPHARSSRR